MNARLPNTFMIGAAKSGTTTLADLLSENPAIYLPFAKEPRFFSNDDLFCQGLAWFEETYYSKAAGYPVRMDATTPYLYWSEKVAPRLKAYDQNDDIKLLAIFRDPVKRIYSMYWQMRRDVRMNISFEDALATEEALYQENYNYFHHIGRTRYGLFRGGCYAALLKPYLELFPRERILLLLHEDLTGDFDATMKKVYAFLGVEPVAHNPKVSNPAVTARNRTLQGFLQKPSGILQALLKQFTRHMSIETRHKLKNRIMSLNSRRLKYPPMQPETARMLRERYRDDILALEQIMGRDLSKWYQD